MESGFFFAALLAILVAMAVPKRGAAMKERPLVGGSTVKLPQSRSDHGDGSCGGRANFPGGLPRGSTISLRLTPRGAGLLLSAGNWVLVRSSRVSAWVGRWPRNPAGACHGSHGCRSWTPPGTLAPLCPSFHVAPPGARQSSARRRQIHGMRRRLSHR